jgi:hypothetical protein
MTRIHEISNASFALYNLAVRREQVHRHPDPFWLALGINLALALAIAVIWAVVR